MLAFMNFMAEHGRGGARPGACFQRSEGSRAKVEVYMYLGSDTSARALRAEREDVQMQLRHRSLRVPVEFLTAYWRYMYM